MTKKRRKRLQWPTRKKEPPLSEEVTEPEEPEKEPEAVVAPPPPPLEPPPFFEEEPTFDYKEFKRVSNETAKSMKLLKAMPGKFDDSLPFSKRTKLRNEVKKIKATTRRLTLAKQDLLDRIETLTKSKYAAIRLKKSLRGTYGD